MKKGKALEVYVAERLREILKDSSIRPTKASGGGVRNSEVGDILNKEFAIECKQRSTKNITINEEVWDKLIGELPLGSTKVPMYILENVTKKRWVCLDLEDFLRILEKANDK